MGLGSNWGQLARCGGQPTLRFSGTCKSGLVLCVAVNFSPCLLPPPTFLPSPSASFLLLLPLATCFCPCLTAINTSAGTSNTLTRRAVDVGSLLLL